MGGRSGQAAEQGWPRWPLESHVFAFPSGKGVDGGHLGGLDSLILTWLSYLQDSE